MYSIIFLLSLFGPTVFLLPSRDYPQPAYVGYVKDTISQRKIVRTGGNAWENSGQLEGDIMIYKDEDEIDMDVAMTIKNGMWNPSTKWPKGIVPYRLEKNSFSPEDVKVIKEAMSTISKNTCIRFRDYQELDSSYIVFRSNGSGCWSLVGHKLGGQVLNLNTEICMLKHIIVHELIHALGFYHQQSTHNRDDYVKIHWENILEGRESSFKKYSASEVTNLGTEYDYKSIMHYSATALSKNGNPTITPLKPGIELGGQEITKTDILKIQRRYKKECESRGN